MTQELRTKAHEVCNKVAHQALKQGKTPRQATIRGLAAEFMVLAMGEDK